MLETLLRNERVDVMRVTCTGMLAPAARLLSKMPDPESVRRLEAEALGLPQIDLNTSHVIHEGMCSRTILVPAGALITGAQTNKPNVCIVSGDITVTTDEGPKRLTGYHVLKADAGFKRAGVAHADTYWTTIWATDLTDIRAIEDEMTDEAALLQTRREGIEYVSPLAIEGA